jgi:hypothetical protein
MTKTIPEIDDEMVARAYEAYRAAYSPTGHASEMIRAALTAALTPSPEIEVTEAMLLAAREATMHMLPVGNGPFLIAAYRAMKAKEAAPKGAKSAPQAYLYWDKNDRRQRGQIVMNDLRKGDRRGRDRFAKQNRQQFYGMTRD